MAAAGACRRLGRGCRRLAGCGRLLLRRKLLGILFGDLAAAPGALDPGGVELVLLDDAADGGAEVLWLLGRRAGGGRWSRAGRGCGFGCLAGCSVAFFDAGDGFADGDGFAFLPDAAEDAGGRGGDIDVGFVGFQLGDGLGGGDGVAIILVPLDERGFLDRLTQCRDGYVGGHSCSPARNAAGLLYETGGDRSTWEGFRGPPLRFSGPLKGDWTPRFARLTPSQERDEHQPAGQSNGGGKRNQSNPVEMVHVPERGSFRK